MTFPLLTPNEIDELLERHPQWSFDGQALTRRYQFASFDEAFAFMADVAAISARQDHHPDWRNRYSLVEVAINDHEAGGVSERDRRWVEAVAGLDRPS